MVIRLNGIALLCNGLIRFLGRVAIDVAGVGLRLGIIFIHGKLLPHSLSYFLLILLTVVSIITYFHSDFTHLFFCFDYLMVHLLAYNIIYHYLHLAVLHSRLLCVLVYQPENDNYCFDFKIYDVY